MKHNSVCKDCGKRFVTVDDLCARCTMRAISRAMRAEGAIEAADTILAICDNDEVGQGSFERALLAAASDIANQQIGSTSTVATPEPPTMTDYPIEMITGRES